MADGIRHLELNELLEAYKGLLPLVKNVKETSDHIDDGLRKGILRTGKIGAYSAELEDIQRAVTQVYEFRTSLQLNVEEDQKINGQIRAIFNGHLF